jgi:hypothetical protein
VRVDQRRLQRRVAEILRDQPQRHAFLEQVRGVTMPQRLPILHMSRSRRRSSIAIIPATGWRSEWSARGGEARTRSTSCNDPTVCRSRCRGGCSTRWPASSSRRKPNRESRSVRCCA